MKGIRITLLTKKEMPEFRRYISRIFHPKHILCNARYLKWQYNHFYIIKSKNTVIGHFGFRDIHYKVYTTTKRVRTLMGFYVLEPYRIFGAGTLLARKIFCTTNPIMVSGYTQATQHLGKKLRPSWQNAGVLTRYLAILDDTTPFLLRYGKRQTLCHLRKKTVRSNTNMKDTEISVSPVLHIPFSEIWHQLRNRYSTTVERTNTYMNWRFVNHPILAYRFLIARRGSTPIGYLIYRYEGNPSFKIARIVDFIATQDAERPLLLTFITEATKKGAHAADFLFSGKLYRKTLLLAGFFNTSKTSFKDFPVLFNPISYKKISINIAYDLPVHFADCYFTKADGDQDRPNPY